MGRRRALRAVAAAFLLSVLLFGGARLARSAVQGITAPLAGLDLLARRPPVAEPAEAPLPASDDLGLISPAAEEPGAAPRPPAKASKPAAKGDAAAALILSARQQLAYKQVFQEMDGQAIKIELASFFARSSHLTLDALPRLAKDLNLTDLQRERIEQWLTWKKEALDALGEKKDPKKVREIEDSTAAAVRAELDFFQAQELDRRRQEGSQQTAAIRWAAVDAMHRVHDSSQATKAEHLHVGEVLKKAAK